MGKPPLHKVILVATNTQGKNLVFASQTLNVLSLERAIEEARKDNIDGAYVVGRKSGTYLRTHPYIPQAEEFETISISGLRLTQYIQGNVALSTPAVHDYIRRYSASLAEGQAYIKPVGHSKLFKVLTADVKEKLLMHRELIFSAAKRFDIDPYTLGAILVDEIARLIPFEDIVNSLGAEIIGVNVSIGVAQMQLDTAHEVIKRGFYNPNPKDEKLPFKRLTNAGRRHLYQYFVEPKHSIFGAAGYLRLFIDDWSAYIDLSNKPEILATLYHIGERPPYKHPRSNERGDQIAEEFYPLARKWLI